MILSFVFVPSYASDSEEVRLPVIISKAEEITGAVVNLFAKFSNLIADINETDIPSPTVNAPSWVEYSDEPSVENPEQIISAETWVVYLNAMV